MHALVGCARFGLEAIDGKGQAYASGISTFGGRVRTATGQVMLFAGLDTYGEPYLIHERFRGRLPAIRRRLTEARRKA